MRHSLRPAWTWNAFILVFELELLSAAGLEVYSPERSSCPACLSARCDTEQISLRRLPEALETTAGLKLQANRESDSHSVPQK